MYNYPVISCICITRAKPQMLKRAIACFTAQSYIEKELIVVYEDDDVATEYFVNTYKHSPGESIRFICVNTTPKCTLGELRNIGIDKATGTFICQWDDDDWCHVNRLEYQYNVIRNTSYKASVLTQWLVFDAIKGNAYISNKRLWEGSLLCCKSLIGQKQYEHVAMGEDTPVIDFLKSSNHICEIACCSNLYIYVYHGCNTWHLAHWEEIFRCSKYLGKKISQEIAMILNGEYQHKEASEIVDWLLQETTI
jgi:glycosyltransferase involved in cell wall biosynthesis